MSPHEQPRVEKHGTLGHSGCSAVAAHCDGCARGPRCKHRDPSPEPDLMCCVS